MLFRSPRPPRCPPIPLPRCSALLPSHCCCQSPTAPSVQPPGFCTCCPPGPQALYPGVSESWGGPNKDRKAACRERVSSPCVDLGGRRIIKKKKQEKRGRLGAMMHWQGLRTRGSGAMTSLEERLHAEHRVPLGSFGSSARTFHSVWLRGLGVSFL